MYKEASAVDLSRFQKGKLAGFLALSVFLLGAAGGALVWAFLKILGMGMGFFWETLPQHLGAGSWYIPFLCLTGGLAMGLFQQKFGILPDTMAEVIAKVKRDGTYDYHRLPAIFTAVLLPLFAGGSLGPEAGLTGIITSLCFAVRDRICQIVFQVRALVQLGSQPGLAVFFAPSPAGPPAGTPPPIFPDPKQQHRVKVLIYMAGVLGGVLALLLLHSAARPGHGLPQLMWRRWAGLAEWKWMPLFAAGGILLGKLYQLFAKGANALAHPLARNRVLSCLTAGAFVSLLGLWNLDNLFSGGGRLLPLTATWQQLPVTLLFLTAVTKLLTTALCLAFGWKGGSIFPIVYSAVSLGYGLAAVTGAGALFAATATTAAACGYLSRRPLLSAAIMLLCFPIRTLVPMLTAAAAGAWVGRRQCRVKRVE